jgi:hypothetical protein
MEYKKINPADLMHISIQDVYLNFLIPSKVRKHGRNVLNNILERFIIAGHNRLTELSPCNGQMDEMTSG